MSQAIPFFREKLHLHVLSKGLPALDLQTSTEAGNLEAESKKAIFCIKGDLPTF